MITKKIPDFIFQEVTGYWLLVDLETFLKNVARQ
jgi:hypothetical protein